MKHLILAAAAGLFVAGAANAQGDAAAGETEFRKCTACHTIASPDETIVRGGTTGPNLYGVFGNTAGAVEGYNYSADLKAAGEAGMVYDEETLAAFILDPKGTIAEATGKRSARSKMNAQRISKPEDLVAYLASIDPDAGAEEGAEAEADGES